MPDAPWEPSMPLRWDATEVQIAERFFHVPGKVHAALTVAEELAAARVAHETAALRAEAAKLWNRWEAAEQYRVTDVRLATAALLAEREDMLTRAMERINRIAAQDEEIDALRAKVERLRAVMRATASALMNWDGECASPVTDHCRGCPFCSGEALHTAAGEAEHG